MTSTVEGYPLTGAALATAAINVPNNKLLAPGSAWMLSGTLLSVGGGVPSLLLAYAWTTVVQLQRAHLVTLFFGIDALFCLSASLVLHVGARFGVQRYGKHTQPYPGPFREAQGKQVPFLMKPYVRAVVYLGLYLPVAAMAYLVWQGQAALGFCTIGVYVLQLLTQIRSEMVFLNKASIMWPQVPQLYQTYRLWQLMRGCALTRALNGPEWLWGIQAYLLLIWYFNFAAVCTWTPWLYRWHLQPKTAGTSTEDSSIGNNTDTGSRKAQ